MTEAWRREITFAGQKSVVVVGSELTQLITQYVPPGHNAFALIGDDNVLPLYGDAVALALEQTGHPCHRRSFPAGEAHKTRQTKEALEDWLLELDLDRSLCIVAVGGGISLDVAGFVAATYLRGVPYINIPSSLLAQVDASVGGKTAVNTVAGKNMIGAFHCPAATVVDTALLSTLPPVEWANGLAELIKHGVIADASLFRYCEDNAHRLAEPGAIEPAALQQAISVKASIVERDPYERNERAILNFGHTVAHALEKASQHAIPHGLAVARGMLAEAELAHQLTGFSREHCSRLYRLTERLRLPLANTLLPFAEIAPFLRADKKRTGAVLRAALPQEIGVMAQANGHYAMPVDLAAIERGWQHSHRELSSAAS